MPGQHSPREGRRGSFLVYQKKDPHPAGDEIFVPAGDLFPAGQKPINLSRVRPTIGPPVGAATVWPSPKKGPISILPLKTRSAEIEFLRAHKQLGKFPHTVGSRAGSHVLGPGCAGRSISRRRYSLSTWNLRVRGSSETELHPLGASQIEDRRPLASPKPVDCEYLGVDVFIH